MRHNLPLEDLRTELGPRADDMAGAIERCVHCGFCLATCPTYLTLGEEMDSPRGRIFLMKEVLEGALDLDPVLEHIDPCLGCLACETSCPSGVEYGQLLQPFQALAERKRKPERWRSMQRRLLLATLASPIRFRMVSGLGRLARPAMRAMTKVLPRAVPETLRTAVELLPERMEPRYDLPTTTLSVGPRRAQVALLAGCAQQVLAPDIHRATLEVLSRNGIEVRVPSDQGCCGALALHAGDEVLACKLALRNLDAFDSSSDAIVTNAAGCGSGLRDASRLFLGSADEERAQRLAGRVRDVSELLDELGLVDMPPPLERSLRVVYQDACHLGHAQRVRAQPRSLLQSVEGLVLVTPFESEVCCGSAGIYNLEQPVIAAELGRRKVQHLLETGAELIVSGNIGCITQIRQHLQKLGNSTPVRHTMQVLRDAYNGRLGNDEYHLQS